MVSLRPHNSLAMIRMVRSVYVVPVAAILLAAFGYYGVKAYLVGGRRDWLDRTERGIAHWIFDRPFSRGKA